MKSPFDTSFFKLHLNRVRKFFCIELYFLIFALEGKNVTFEYIFRGKYMNASRFAFWIITFKFKFWVLGTKNLHVFIHN